MPTSNLRHKTKAWAEKLKAYIHLLLTWRYVLSEVVTTETFGPWTSVSIRVRTRMPHYTNETYIMRPVPSGETNMILPLATLIGIETARKMKFPPTTIIAKYDGKTIAIVE